MSEILMPMLTRWREMRAYAERERVTPMSDERWLGRHYADATVPLFMFTPVYR